MSANMPAGKQQQCECRVAAASSWTRCASWDKDRDLKPVVEPCGPGARDRRLNEESLLPANHVPQSASDPRRCELRAARCSSILESGPRGVIISRSKRTLVAGDLSIAWAAGRKRSVTPAAARRGGLLSDFGGRTASAGSTSARAELAATLRVKPMMWQSKRCAGDKVCLLYTSPSPRD